MNINLFRKAQENTVINGYPVEEGTPLTAELSLIMSDERFFDNNVIFHLAMFYEFQFDPSRFLKNDKLDQHVIPFGLGKRSCLGESLARAELYLVSSSPRKSINLFRLLET